MRDLHAVATSSNNREPIAEADPEALEQDRAHLEAVEQQLRTVRREQKQAGMAVMLLDTAKVLEPVIELLCDRALRWAALACTVGLAAFAMRQPSWERLSILAAFAILAPWVIRRGK